MFTTEKAPGEIHERSDRELEREGLDETAKLLLKAAAVIDEIGWCQNGYTKHGGYCIYGALDHAAGFDVGEGATNQVVSQAAWRFIDAVKSSVAGWNDTPGRTKDEVVAKLRAVALGS